MKEVGIVRQQQGKKARVSIQRHAACGDCGACHVGKDKMTMEALAYNEIGAEVGALVEVEMQFANVLKASMIAYGIPLVVFIAGAIFGYYLLNPMLGAGESPIPAFVTGIVLTAITYMAIRIMDNKGIFTKGYEPHITAILDSCD